jgi:hypothetical protein
VEYEREHDMNMNMSMNISMNMNMNVHILVNVNMKANMTYRRIAAVLLTQLTPVRTTGQSGGSRLLSDIPEWQRLPVRRSRSSSNNMTPRYGSLKNPRRF